MTAPVVARTTTITYGGVSIGGSTNYQINGLTIYETDYTQMRLSVDVLVQDTTLATFVSQCATLEAAFRKPNGALLVTQGSSTWLDLDPADNTAFLAQSSIRKIGSPADSDNSRLYRIEIRMQLPADETGKSGRQSSSVRLVTDAQGVRSLFVSATYTALTTNAALAQAQSVFPTYASGLITSLTGTWDEVLTTEYVHDSDNKVCRASAGYRELIYAQSASGTNDSTLVGMQIEVVTGTSSANSDTSANASALLGLFVSFSTGVIKSQSQDLRSVYQNTVRPYMVTVAQSLSGTSTIALLEDRWHGDPMNNTIRGSMEFMATGDNSLVSAQTSVSILEVPPENYVPVANGDPYARDRHSGPGFLGYQVTADVTEIASSRNGLDIAFSSVESWVSSAKRNGFVVTRIARPVDILTEYGVPNVASKIRLRTRRLRVTLEKANIQDTSGGGSKFRIGVATSSARSKALGSPGLNLGGL